MAAKRKTNKNDKRKEKLDRFSFFSDMDPDTRSVLLKGLGLVVAVFTVFTAVSILSYLFTWEADQSLMSHPDMLDKGVKQVANVVQANSATAEESASASQQLSAQAELLQESVKGFRLRS